MQHVLLVDDDVNFRRSLVIQLEFEGYRVTEVESAHQALTYLEHGRDQGQLPDMIVTDVKMGGMSGEEFVRILKETFPRLPVLVISAFSQPEGLHGCPFLRKPFKIQQMVEVIDHCLQMNQ